MKTTLVSIKISDFKKIKNLQLDFKNGESYLLTGKNEVGKTSVIQAFKIAMGIENPVDGLVTQGKKKGEIEVIVDKGPNQYKINVYVKEDKDKISFEVNDGQIKSPKGFVRALAGPYFDMVEMVDNQKSAEGRRKNQAFFLKLAKLDPEKIEKDEKEIAARELERHDTGQAKAAARGYVDKMNPIVQPDVYFEKKSVVPVTEKYNEDRKKNTRNYAEEATVIIEAYKPKFKNPIELTKKMGELKLKIQERQKYLDAKQRGEGQIKILETSITDFEAQIKALEDKITDARNKIDKAKFDLQETIEPVLRDLDHVVKEADETETKLTVLESDNQDVQIQLDAELSTLKTAIDTYNVEQEATLKAKFDQDLKDIEDWNINVEDAQDFLAKKQELEELESTWTDQQRNIVSLRQALQDYILSGSFPIEGMEYDLESKQVVYYGLKISEETMSSGQIIKLGIQLSIAYNPDGINLIVVPNASLLDEDKLAEIQHELKEHGMYGLFEIVERHQETLKIEVLKEETED